MTIAIGRAGRDTGLTLNSPTYWSVSGNEVDLVGALTADSLAKLFVLRYQVAGLADNRDEPAVAVNWTGDSTVDGFYEVIDASVPMPPRGLAALKLDYRLRLRNLGASPQIESRLLGALRTNSHTIAKGVTVPWWATPADATMDYVAGATTATRTGDGATVKVAYTTDGTLLYDATPTWQCVASDCYDGAAKVEVTDGSSWYTLVGRNIPGSTLLLWRISNGLVRVTYGGGNGLLSVQHYSAAASAWLTAKTYKLTRGSTPTTLGAFRAITILRNSPEEVVVRLSVEQDSTSYPAQINVDLRLRRGALWVEGTVTRSARQLSAAESASTDFNLGIFRNTTEAGTAHTSGVHATAADAGTGGGKYVLTSPTATNVDTTNGGISQGYGPSPNLFQFMVGYEPPSAAGPDTFTNQVYAYFAATTESQRLVRR